MKMEWLEDLSGGASASSSNASREDEQKAQRSAPRWQQCLCGFGKWMAWALLYTLLLVCILLNSFLILASVHPTACDVRLALLNSSSVCHHYGVQLSYP